MKDENNPTAIYEELYEKYEAQKFAEVVDESDQYIAEFSGDEIVPKLELLKAMAQGRLYGFEQYRESLNYVALNYPQAEEGKKAKEILEKALPSLAGREFVADSAQTSFKLVFPFDKPEREQVVELREKVLKALSELGYNNEVSIDVYNEQEDFVVVHGFSSVAGAKSFAQQLSEKKNYGIDKKSFYISTPNYRIAQIHKNIETYLNSLNTPPQ